MQFVENGKLLGRTGQSWARILGFYAVYYTFLAALIYFSVTQYADNLEQPGINVKSKINSRQDMPGASVFPFNSIKKDGDDNVIQLSADGKNKENHNELYIAHMKKWLESYQGKSQANAIVCNNAEDVKSSTCKIPNAKVLEKENDVLEESISKQTPIFTVALNKNYNWNPASTKNFLPNQSNNLKPWEKNSVQVDCFEVDNASNKVENSKFNIDLLGDNIIRPKFYPFIGQDKGGPVGNFTYNKPFVVGKISAKEGKAGENAWEVEKDSKIQWKLFRCEFYADNIQRPLTGEALKKAKDAGTQGWSEDLTKLGIGYTQFGFKYV